MKTRVRHRCIPVLLVGLTAGILLGATAVRADPAPRSGPSDAVLEFTRLQARAMDGDVAAMLELAGAYESGTAVARNLLQAYHWYNEASAAGAPNMGAALDRLERSMHPDDVRIAQHMDSHAFCSWSRDKLPLHPMQALSFDPGADASQVVAEIRSAFSLTSRTFNVAASSEIPNAAAFRDPNTGDRMVLYNPSFMSQAKSSAGTNWSVYAVMAHEIGHHIQDHTFSNLGSRPDWELEADEFAGNVCGRLGASLTEVQAIYSQFPDVDSPTHPRRSLRLQAVQTGWAKGAPVPVPVHPTPGTGSSTQPTQTGSVPDPPVTRPRQQPRRTPPPSQPVLAANCATPYGNCQLMAPVPQGAPCFCMDPMTGFRAFGIAY